MNSKNRLQVVEILSHGDVVTLQFRRNAFPGDFEIGDAVPQIRQLVRSRECHTLIFDVSLIEEFSSAFLGLLTVPKRYGVRTIVCNASHHLNSVLRRTGLSKMLESTQCTDCFRLAASINEEHEHTRTTAKPSSNRINIAKGDQSRSIGMNRDPDSN